MLRRAAGHRQDLARHELVLDVGVPLQGEVLEPRVATMGERSHLLNLGPNRKKAQGEEPLGFTEKRLPVDGVGLGRLKTRQHSRER